MSRAIVLGITANYAFAAGALLASILEHDPNFDATVVILHDGLDDDVQAAFLRLWSRCEFRSFTLADVEARLGVSGEDAHVAEYISHFSPLVFAKLELPALLDTFDRVVWLDADMLVRGPLDALWEFDCVAWRPLPKGAFARRAKVLSVFADRELDRSVPLLNGGVIGVSRRFKELGGSLDMIHDMTRQLVKRAPSTQLAEMPWYLVAASLGLPVTSYPMTLNHPVGAPNVTSAVIVHAIGPHKFWNATPLVQLFPDWARHQARWEGCGGRPYDGPVMLSETHPAEASELLRVAQTRAYWLSIFPDLRQALPMGMVFDLRHDRKYLRVFLHGRSEEQHLRLVQQPNERRLGLEAPRPSDLPGRVAMAVCGLTKGARLEKGALVSVPVAQIGAALAAAEAVIYGT